MKNYNELIVLKTFDERLDYLRLFSNVCENTFGGNRYFNQKFYMSEEWKKIRRNVIIRDNGCDMALEGYDINTKHDRIMIHHIVPITYDDIINHSPKLIDMNNLVCVRYNTHNLIHYSKDNGSFEYTPRFKNDTKLW